MLNAAQASPHVQATPRKLFYRIQEVSKITGLKPYVLRYWESEFKELNPAKDASEQRRYRQCDIEVVMAIRKLLYDDRYTIKGARLRLKEELRQMRRQSSTVAEPAGEALREEEVKLPLLTVTAPPEKSEPAGAQSRGDKQLDHTLQRLRREVNELLNMLSH